MNKVQRTTRRARGVDRIVDILEALREVGAPISAGQLATHLAAPRSTVYELVHTLSEAGILETNPTTGEVFFGLSMHFYGSAFVKQNPVVSVGVEEVTRLGRATGETAELCTLIGSRYAIVHSVPGNSLIRVKTVPG